MSEQINPYHSPQADLDNAPSTQAIIATRMDRFLGGLIDGVLMIAAVLGIYAIVDWSHLINPANAVTKTLSGIALFWAMQGWLLFKRGKTIGKLVMKTQIAPLDSTEIPTQQQILLRYLPMQLGGLIPFIGPFVGLINILFIFGQQRRCLHDLIADTRVIYRD